MALPGMTALTWLGLLGTSLHICSLCGLASFRCFQCLHMSFAIIVHLPCLVHHAMLQLLAHVVRARDATSSVRAIAGPVAASSCSADMSASACCPGYGLSRHGRGRVAYMKMGDLPGKLNEVPPLSVKQ